MASDAGAPRPTGARVRVACDGCEAGAWIGPGAAGTDGWCEACQRGAHLPAGTTAPCPACGGPLAVTAPRFPGLWGQLQNLEAVLAAWTGDAAPLAALLPERPRFVADLAVPAAAPGDPPDVAAALAAAARGEWAAVLAVPAIDAPRALAARAIAHERLGDAAAALEAWTRALAHGEWPQARLARGALHARASRWSEAEADLALAGEGREGRWNRAALRVHRAIAETPGRPDARALAAARAEAGEASAYWSEPTVGRLAFSLLGERALARREAGELGDLDLGALREGEDQLEHATFWDRALVLSGWARLGSGGDGDATRVARPLARELAAALLAEPAVKGASLAGAREALERAWDAVAAFEPRVAREAIAPWLAHEALRRYRLPCLACGRGTVGADTWDESAFAEVGGEA